MDTRNLNHALQVADRLVAVLRDQLAQAELGKDVDTDRIAMQLQKVGQVVGGPLEDESTETDEVSPEGSGDGEEETTDPEGGEEDESEDVPPHE